MRGAEDLAQSATAILLSLSKAERLQWRDSETTKALKLLARSQISQFHEAWEAGVFTRESIEAGAMKNAEAIGSLEAWRELIEFIDSIASDDEEYSDND